MSINNPTVIFFETNDSSMIPTRLLNAWSHDFPRRKPYCRGCRNSPMSMAFSRCQIIRRSRDFSRHEDKLIMRKCFGRTCLGRSGLGMNTPDDESQLEHI